MSNKAFIIEDVQNDFISGTLALNDGDAVVPLINNVLHNQQEHFKMIVYTADWHSKDHISFYENRNLYNASSNATQFTKTELTRSGGDKYEQILWPAHCIEGTERAEYHKDLVIVNDALHIKKGVH